MGGEPAAGGHRERAVVSRPEAVGLLLDPLAARRLAPFLHGEQTLTSAAAVLACAPSTAAYWIRRFLDVGLIEPTRVQRRAGAPLRWYRAPAATLVVPGPALPPGLVMDYYERARSRPLHRFGEALRDRLLTGDGGMVFSAPEPDAIDMNVEPALPDRPNPCVEVWATIRLDDAAYGELVAELSGLVERYLERGRGDAGRDVLLHLGAIPSPERSTLRR